MIFLPSEAPPDEGLRGLGAGEAGAGGGEGALPRGEDPPSAGVGTVPGGASGRAAADRNY